MVLMMLMLMEMEKWRVVGDAVGPAMRSDKIDLC